MLSLMGKTFFMSGTANSSEPVWTQFQDLAQYMTAQGFSLKKDLPADYLISLNYSKSEYSSFIRSGGNSRHAALVLLEPEAVYPLQYRDRILRKYSLILRPGNPARYEKLGEFIGWPYEVNANPLTPSRQGPSLKKVVLKNSRMGLFEFDNWINRPQYITLINSNKVSASPVENYSLRRHFAHNIDSKLLSVYGDLWNSTLWKKFRHRIEILFFSLIYGQIPSLRNTYGQVFWRYPAAKGLIDDKHAVLQKTKFNIVIENDPSYVSEKIFDSMINGCIPLYLGPSISNDLIPFNTYINLPVQPQQLIDSLQSIESEEIEAILNSIHGFVRSSLFTTIWEKDAVFLKLGKEIANHFGGGND